VDGVLHAALDRDYHGLVHLVAADHADARLARSATDCLSVLLCLGYSVLCPLARAGRPRPGTAAHAGFRASRLWKRRRCSGLDDSDDLLTQHCVEARDVLADDTKPKRIIQRLRSRAELEAESLLLQLGDADPDVALFHLADVFTEHLCAPPDEPRIST